MSKGKRGIDWKQNFSSIRLERFKAFEDSGNIELKPLTFIVGKNSSGKSTILKSIASLAQSVAKYEDTDYGGNRMYLFERNPHGEIILSGKGKFVDVGRFEDISSESIDKISTYSRENNLDPQERREILESRNFKISFGCGQSTIKRILRSYGLEDTEENINAIKDLWISYKFEPSKDYVDSEMRELEIGKAVNNKNIGLSKDALLNVRTIVAPAKKWYIGKLDEGRVNYDAFEEGIKRRLGRFYLSEDTEDPLEKLALKKLNIKIEDIYPIVVDVVRLTHAYLNPINIMETPIAKKFLKIMKKEKMFISENVGKSESKKKNKEKFSKYDVGFVIFKMMMTLFERKIQPLSLISDIISKELSAVRYIGPLRSEPRREVHEATEAFDQGTKGENIVQYLNKADKETKLKLHKTLQKLGMGKSTRIEHLRGRRGTKSGFLQLYVRLEDGSERQLIDLGFGVSQVLPILLECSVREKSTILLEQPELHLHPGLQTELAEVLLDSCDRDNQIIIESHSVNMIERIRRRIREGKLHHATVNVIYVGKNEEGASRVDVLEFDEDGDFTRPWPDEDGFFGERDREVFSDLF